MARFGPRRPEWVPARIPINDLSMRFPSPTTRHSPHARTGVHLETGGSIKQAQSAGCRLKAPVQDSREPLVLSRPFPVEFGLEPQIAETSEIRGRMTRCLKTHKSLIAKDGDHRRSATRIMDGFPQTCERARTGGSRVRERHQRSTAARSRFFTYRSARVGPQNFTAKRSIFTGFVSCKCSGMCASDGRI